jgi:hypothetical protein
MRSQDTKACVSTITNEERRTGRTPEEMYPNTLDPVACLVSDLLAIIDAPHDPTGEKFLEAERIIRSFLEGTYAA